MDTPRFKIDKKAICVVNRSDWDMPETFTPNKEDVFTIHSIRGYQRKWLSLKQFSKKERSKRNNTYLVFKETLHIVKANGYPMGFDSKGFAPLEEKEETTTNRKVGYVPVLVDNEVHEKALELISNKS